MRYRKIVNVMNEKSREIYTEKRSEVKDGQEDMSGPKDVISSLSEFLLVNG